MEITTAFFQPWRGIRHSMRYSNGHQIADFKSCMKSIDHYWAETSLTK